jgi:predicted transcriptional regulator
MLKKIILTKLKRIFLPKYSKWQVLVVYYMEESIHDIKTESFKLIEMREHKHSGKKYFKTTTQFECIAGTFTAEELQNKIKEIESNFRDFKKHPF